MLRIGLTGGIGSGKSTVAEVFKVLGIPVFDADNAAKKIMNEDAAVKEALIGQFGPETFTGGILNRKYLAAQVFNDAYRLQLLNAIVHPATIKAAELWMQEKSTPYAVKEAALLFEAGSAAGLDYIIGVTAPKALRIQRVMNRDGITRDEVLSRMNRQIDEDIKMRLCDFVIINDEQQLLLTQVLTLHTKLVHLSNQTQ